MFRAKVLQTLKKIRHVYPALRVETSITELTIHPSATAIAPRPGVLVPFVGVVKAIPEAEPDPAALAMWAAAKDRMRESMSLPTFQNWIRPTQGFALQGSMLEVRVPSEYFSNLGERFSAEISAAIDGCVAVTAVRFVVQSEPAPKPPFIDRPPRRPRKTSTVKR